MDRDANQGISNRPSHNINLSAIAEGDQSFEQKQAFQTGRQVVFVNKHEGLPISSRLLRKA
jgi:hypothetical protein